APSVDPDRARAPPRGVAAAGRECDDCGAGRGRRRLGRARGREGDVRSLAAHGLALGVPPGWEGRIQRRLETTAQRPDGSGAWSRPGIAETTAQRPEGSGAWSRPGIVAERTRAVVHLANFAL